jgi:beta-mannosidase
MAKQVREFFGEAPETLDDFVFASQAVQAEAKKFFIEWFRQGKWRRTGILWWNLIDGWPQFSDAVVDYYWQKKMAYYFIRTSQQLLCLLLEEPTCDNQRLLACNDTREDVRVGYKVRDVDGDKVVLAGQGVAKADSVTSLGEIPFAEDQHRLYVIDWRTQYGESANHYLAGRRPFDLQQYLQWLEASQLYPHMNLQ